MYDAVDINENAFRNYDPEVLNMLLVDHTTYPNMCWITNGYEDVGGGYGYYYPIALGVVTAQKSCIS